MTNTNNNKHVFTYEAKFTSHDLYTSRMIENMIEKYKLPNNEYTKIAISSFLAYGPHDFKVIEGKYDVEILQRLLEYGVLFKYQDEENLYRVWSPNTDTSFRTVKHDPNAPWVETTYRTNYSDGTNIEVPEDMVKFTRLGNPY